MNALSAWICFQILISLACILCMVLNRSGTHSEQLRFHYRALAILLVVWITQWWMPVSTSFRPMEKMNASEPLARAVQFVSHPDHSSAPLEISRSSDPSWLWSNTHLSAYLLGLLLILAALKITHNLRALSRFQKNAFRIRRVGRVEILAQESIEIPLSFWTSRASVVMVPASMLSDLELYRVSVLHELQHHRQRDPVWMIALEILKWISFLNPFALAWMKRITELQEFACDETLVGQRKVNSRQYARCLLQVAETALHSEFAPACATGFLFRMKRHPLKRRMKMLLTQSPLVLRRKSSTLAACLCLTLGLTAFAYSAKAIADAQTDQTISQKQGEALLTSVKNAGTFPLQMNELVLKELNSMVGSSSRRQTVREGLARMKQYQVDVDASLDQHQLPLALDAIPLIESNYQNLKADQDPSKRPAGLWQFIPETARHFDLTVNETKDERMDIAKLNFAAGKMISGDEQSLKDLGLAVLAFNWGAKKVNQLIQQNGTRSAWQLVEANHNDYYLPRLVAAMIIVAHPELAKN